MYKIVKIHKNDAFYKGRKEITGLVGDFSKSKFQSGVPKGFFAGEFISSKKIMLKSDKKSGKENDEFYFYAVKVEEVK